MNGAFIFLAGLMLGLSSSWLQEQFKWFDIQPNTSPESTCRAASAASVVDNSAAFPAPETTPSSNEWRWAPSGSCAAGTEARKHLLITPAPSEVTAGEFAPTTLAQAAATFRACGVVAIAPPKMNTPAGAAHASLLDTVEASVAKELAPVLVSRKRVRSALRNAMADHGNLRSLWQRVKGEVLFASGHWCRERDDGRLDQKLPFRKPYNDSSIVGAGLGLSLIAALLGDRAELKSAHAIHALGRSSTTTENELGKQNDVASKEVDVDRSDEAFATAREPQHWHRDTNLLWSSSSMSSADASQSQHQQRISGPPAHDMHNGFFSPAYAINSFVPLRDLHNEDGPTEFTLGSHLWGDVWSDWEKAEAPLYDHVFADSPRGTAIFADYRTVHRGTVNKSPRTRTLLMYIFGRDWWEDRTNYGLEDYGGSSTDDGATPFATRVVRRAARQHEQEAAQSDILARSLSVNDDGDGKAKDEVPQSVFNALSTHASESARERMYWALVSLWEEGIGMELAARFAASARRR